MYLLPMYLLLPAFLVNHCYSRRQRAKTILIYNFLFNENIKPISYILQITHRTRVGYTFPVYLFNFVFYSYHLQVVHLQFPNNFQGRQSMLDITRGKHKFVDPHWMTIVKGNLETVFNVILRN